MIKFKIFLLVYITLFYFSSQAQTDKSLNSTRANSGLVFINDHENRLEDSTYTNAIQLLNLSEKAQAIQFRILLNKSADDSPILVFKDVQKGSDLANPDWLLEYNLIQGPAGKKDASQDEIFVLIYNANQNTGLIPGDYFDLINVKYSIAKLDNTQKNIKSSIKISNAEASSSNGTAIDIKPTHGELKIFVKSKQTAK